MSAAWQFVTMMGLRATAKGRTVAKIFVTRGSYARIQNGVFLIWALSCLACAWRASSTMAALPTTSLRSPSSSRRRALQRLQTSQRQRTHTS